MLQNIIDEYILRNAFFYPASEADLFPLMHFEYPAFIYVDFMHDLSYMDYDLKSEDFLKMPDPYRVVNEVQSYDLADLLNMDDLEDAKEILKKVISADKINFLLSESNLYKKGKEIKIFDLEKASGKKSKFICMHYEGLFAYLLLFRKGLIAPKVLCTTITGHSVALEEMFPLLLNELKVIPDFWITYNSKCNFYKNLMCKIRWEGTCDIFDADVYASKWFTALFNVFSNKGK